MEVRERLITVGVDGSEEGRRALAWAVRHAAATGADVDVVTAWSWDGTAFFAGALGGPGEAQAYAAARNHADVKKVLGDLDAPPTVTPRVVEGDAVTVLARAAQDSELLVVGRRRRGRLASALLGSASAAPVRRAANPVVVVPAADEPRSWWVRPPGREDLRTAAGEPLTRYVARSMGAP